MLKRSKNIFVLAGLAVMVVVTGCAATSAAKYTDFGETLTHAKDAATVTDPAQAKAYPQDGERMRKIMEEYRKEVGAPEEVEKELQPGSGGTQ